MRGILLSRLFTASFSDWTGVGPLLMGLFEGGPALSHEGGKANFFWGKGRESRQVRPYLVRAETHPNGQRAESAHDVPGEREDRERPARGC